MELKDGHELTFVRAANAASIFVGEQGCQSIALKAVLLPCGSRITVAAVKNERGDEYYIPLVNAEEFG